MTASVTGSPRYASASLLSFIKIWALISWGVHFFPSMSTVQSVPMWRLTEEMVRSTLVTACLFATSPTRISPFLAKATTEGVVLCPSELTITVGCPPSRVAMQELVVPKSIPTERPIAHPPFPGAGTLPARFFSDSS